MFCHYCAIEHTERYDHPDTHTLRVTAGKPDWQAALRAELDGIVPGIGIDFEET